MYNHRQKKVSGNTETVASLDGLCTLLGFSMRALRYGTINLVVAILYSYIYIYIACLLLSYTMDNLARCAKLLIFVKGGPICDQL